MIRIFQVLLFLLLCPLAVSAASFQVHQRSDAAWRGLNEPAFLECGVTLSGPIEAGDTERLRDLTSEYGVLPVLCLDSEGGLFSEGLRLAQYIRERQLVTVVEAGRQCLSACAIAFMGGTYGEMGVQIQRYMHPTASVGFHAPSLNLPDGTSPNVIVETAYRDALSDISRTLLTLVLATDSGGQPYFSPYLLADMLNTPADEMLFAETVNDAGLWDIGILHFPANFDHARQAPIGCLNAVYWAWGEVPPENVESELDNTVIEPTDYGLIVRVFPNGAFETICTWSSYTPGRLMVEGMRNGDFFSHSPVLLLPGDTLLRSLSK